MLNTKKPAPSTSSHTDTTIEVAGGMEASVRMYGSKKRGEVSPLVVHFHGGAFVTGDLDNGSTVGNSLATAGACVVSVAYPLAPEHPFPRPLELGYAVLQWAYKQRAKLAGKGAPLYLAGEEAGANLAAGVCMMARDQLHPPLAGQILISPMLDPCAATPSQRAAQGDSVECKWASGWCQYLGGSHDALHPYAVPARAHRLAGLPPTLILVGGDDPMRDEALGYAQRLEAAGLTVFQHVFEGAGQWPDALVEPPPEPCPCAVQMQEQLHKFFETTRCRL
ncbi:acetyl esterase/lipase [Comamonas odontotermitis]|uniref:Acetyl esterase/lipase n=1 Tax=Comamonas odontotermitis TaxID=379895 RepID=A0ABR6RGH7_9BURK|nr:alpha/beta hydrolase [Comamonas odontotermitis]MBB6578258.1 acetyl esterase/lipase [Comamonas odontotermitis]